MDPQTIRPQTRDADGQYVFSYLSNLSMAISMLADSVGAQLPAAKPMMDGLTSNLQTNLQMANEAFGIQMMEGRGSMATAYRRVYAILGKADVEAEDLIKQALPKKHNEQEIRSTLIDAATKLVGYEIPLSSGHNGSLWVSRSQDKDMERYLARNTTTSLNGYGDTLERHPTGLYLERNPYYYSGAPRYFLVLHIDAITVVEIHDNRSIVVWSKVEVEDSWVRHADTRYVDQAAFTAAMAQLHEQFYSSVADEIYDGDGLRELVTQQLREHPLTALSTDSDTWRQAIGSVTAKDACLLYGKRADEDDWLLQIEHGGFVLQFQFEASMDRAMEVLPRCNSFQLYRKYEANNGYPGERRYRLAGVDWDGLPVRNKITLAKELVDTIRRVSENERQAVEPVDQPAA